MSKPSNPLPGKANKAPSAISLSDTEVSENSSGAPIGLLTVADPNKKDTHTFTVDDPRFEIALVDNQWWLYLKRGVTLDYETTSLLTVQVTATDQGGLSKTENFTIGVADVNDAPVITTTSLSVDENARFLGSISAADLDGSASGYRNEWRFSLVDDSSDNGLFSIDPSSGALSFVSEAGADYETGNTYNVEVRVEDVTNPILSTTRSISIGVRDVNEAPTTVSLETQAVPENTTGAAIGVLSSEDPDQGDTLSYQIFKASPSGGLLLVEGEPVIDSRFTVDGGNLALAPGSSLDYETTPTVGIVVRAIDPGGLFKDQEFNISVLDQNDEEPRVDTKPDGLIELNGHYYQIVEDPNVGPLTASQESGELSFIFEGSQYQGHLATVSSATEEALIEEAIFEAAGNRYFSQEPAAYWLGGEFVNGSWEWTSGPEAGQELTFSDWGGTEATQGSSEPYLVLNMFGRSDINGVWYSYDAGDTALARGYVVEYEILG